MLEAITEGIPDRLRSWSLRTYGLIAVLIAAVLSVTANILILTGDAEGARIPAALAMTAAPIACVLLSVHAIFTDRDEDL